MTTLDGTQKLRTDRRPGDRRRRTRRKSLAGVMGGAQSMVHAGAPACCSKTAWFGAGGDPRDRSPPRLRATDSSATASERGVDHGVEARASGPARALASCCSSWRAYAATAWTDAAGERPPAPTIAAAARRGWPRCSASRSRSTTARRGARRSPRFRCARTAPRRGPAWRRRLAAGPPPRGRPDRGEPMRFHGFPRQGARRGSMVPAGGARRPTKATSVTRSSATALVEGLRDAGLHEHVAMAFVARVEDRVLHRTASSGASASRTRCARREGVMRAHAARGCSTR